MRKSKMARRAAIGGGLALAALFAGVTGPAVASADEVNQSDPNITVQTTPLDSGIVSRSVESRPLGDAATIVLDREWDTTLIAPGSIILPPDIKPTTMPRTEPQAQQLILIDGKPAPPGTTVQMIDGVQRIVLPPNQEAKIYYLTLLGNPDDPIVTWQR